MAKAKKEKETKAKEPIRIRYKELSNGNKSIYLDTYQNGERTYEFLKLYLIPEVDETAEKQNANTLAAATFIKSKRLMALMSQKSGMPNKEFGKMKISDWLLYYLKEQQGNRSRARIKTYTTAIKTVCGYDSKTPLVDIDDTWLYGLIRYLNAVKKHDGTPLKGSSRKKYYDVLNAALSFAVREKAITNNPCRLISDTTGLFHVREANVAYLEEAELNKLMETPCGNEQVKRAYLFSCFSGLRLGDVERLTWGGIKSDKIEIEMQKTEKPLIVPLADKARTFLPERGDKANGDLVFTLPSRWGIKYHLERWAKAAGIDKNLTYHTSRHTFATTLLTAGADIYTTSALMGHAKVTTTQRYAKIVNEKKVEAINLLNALFDK